MIDLFEKVALGLGALAVGGTLLLYVVMGGTPSTQAVAFLPKVQRIAPQSSTPKNGQPAGTPAKPVVLTQPDRPVLEKLRKQGNRRVPSTLRREAYSVPEPLFEEIAKPANYTKELKKAKSTVLGNTRLKIHGIQSDSLFKQFGIQDGDIIELIDGEILEFNEGASTRYVSLWKDKLQSLRDGGAISLTISRGGVPLHLEFKL